MTGNPFIQDAGDWTVLGQVVIRAEIWFSLGTAASRKSMVPDS